MSDDKDGGHSVWETLMHFGAQTHAGFEIAGGARHGLETAGKGLQAFSHTEAHHLSQGQFGSVAHYLAPFTLASGVHEMIYGDSAVDKLHGGLETIAGGIGTMGLVGSVTGIEALSALSAGLAPVALLAGAGAGGVKLGDNANKTMRNEGWLGENADGTNRNWSDVAGETLNHPGTAMKFGEVAGGAALLGGAFELGTTIGGIPKMPTNPAEIKKMKQAAERKQAEANTTSQSTYDKLVKSGTGAQAAEYIAGVGNSEWKEQHGVERDTHTTYDAALKAGMSADVALHMARLTNPGWKGPSK